jgi:hypothetical protein
MTLLFRLAEWHAFAKLRMHTETTLTLMDSATEILGRELRRFQSTTCSAFSTRELPRERAARARKASRKQASKTSTSAEIPLASPETPNPSPPRKRRRKMFNLSTYKTHAIGDYGRTIRMYGPTDSYSTQTVCILVFSLDTAKKNLF